MFNESKSTMKLTTLLLSAALVASGSAASAASLLFSQTLTPQSGSGSTTFFDYDNNFDETFDFSGAAIDTIEEFRLTLIVSGARDEFVGFPPGALFP